MTNTLLPKEPIKKEELNEPTAKNKNVVENHKQAAIHHQEAAKHHNEAVKQHEAGNLEKAALSTLKANGHHALAEENQSEIAKHHAIKS